jgi:hypothetical protein
MTKYEILFDLLAEHGWFIERGNRPRSSPDWNRSLWLVCEGGRNSGVIVGEGETPDRAVEDAVKRLAA